MHDFCLTIPYGMLVAFGGISGYFYSGSVMSLTAGGGIGAVLTFLGYCSYQEYLQSPCVSKVWAGVSLVLSSTLTGVMGNRYYNTGAVFPAGVVAGLSGAMSVFYVTKLLQTSKPDYRKH